jgi:ribosomal protein S18 acetylase RimI-like enzyme
MTMLVPMTEPEYLQYVEASIPDYAAEKVASGLWSAAESLELSSKALAELLPQGRETPGNHLFTIFNGESAAVGMLWIAEQVRAGQRIAYVYDVSVRPEYRRQGYATLAFAALEDKARSLGLSGIALHVFGHNTGAYALYVKLGYLATNINMFKRLE